MKASCRFALAALASLAAGGAGVAQTATAGGHPAVAPGSAAGWSHHGPFHVCPDARSNTGCVVETGVRARAGNRVEVRARGRVNFGGGLPLELVNPLLGGPPVPGSVAEALRDPDGEAATDPGYPAPGLRKNSLLVLVAQPATGILPRGGKAGKLYQGGTSTSFTPGEDGDLVLMVNDARPEDNRAVCEAGLCGWEVTLDVYDAPAAGAPRPSAGPPPLPGGTQPPAAPVSVVTKGPGSVPQPPPSTGGESRPGDVEGSTDPPLLPRARGSVIRTYDLKRVDAYLLPLGPAVGSGFARSEKVRGQVTFLVYELAPDCSVLEAGEHYAAALRKAGFETLFACEDAECGPDYGPYDSRHPAWSPSYGERQITAVLRRGGGHEHASVHVQGDSPASGRAWVVVVESGLGGAAPVAGGVGGGAGPRPGPASQGSPAPGIGASAPQGSGPAAQGQQPPAAGAGAGAQGARSPASGIGASAPQGSGSPPPALTAEQRQALEKCVNDRLLGLGALPGALAAQQQDQARAACERELQIPRPLTR